MMVGVQPINLMIGISAALNYDDKSDSDVTYLKYLNDFGIPAFLDYHLKIGPETIESRYISQNAGPAWEHLERNMK